MRSISHRELRNRSGEVLREVSQGETYEVTNRGKVVARIVPACDEPELRCVRRARTRPTWSALPRLRAAERAADVLDDLRRDR